MRKIQPFAVIVMACLLAACSSPKITTGVWVNKEKIQGKTFNSIFIIVMTADIQARVQLEKDLAVAAEARGLKAVKSIDVMAPSLSDPKTPTKEEIISKVKASGCNAVFVASLLKKDESIRYTESTSAYTVLPYYSYYGTYYGFYSNFYTTVYTPGYYTQEKSYFMLSNLFDVASEEIMWSAQSKVFDPSTLTSFSRSYIATLLKQLEAEKLLKK